jgi:hypothetical protein
MKKLSFLILWTGIIFPTLAFELEVKGGASSFYFQETRTDTDNVVNGLIFPYIDVDVTYREEFGDFIGVKVGFESSEILRRIFFAEMSLRSDYFSLSLGPYYGLFNTVESWLVPGLRAKMDWVWPGFLVAGIGFTNNFQVLVDVGDYSHEQNMFNFGAYFPNGLLTLEARLEKFQLQKTATNVITDEVNDFNGTLEVFTKFLPVRLELTGGFYMLYRRYSQPDVTQNMNFAYAGGGITNDIGANFSWFLRGAMPIYPVTFPPLINEIDSGIPLYRGEAGITIKL